MQRQTLCALGLSAAMIALASAAGVHADGRFDAPSSNPMARINDLYAWMASYRVVNLAMTVSPADDGTRSFGPSVQYVFHVASRTQTTEIGSAPTNETKIVCVFASNTSVQCWVGDAQGVASYVSGDPSGPAGIVSDDRRLRVFAGRRSDPFFFNAQGLRDFAAVLPTVVPDPDGAGCPRGVDVGIALALRNILARTPPSPSPPCTTASLDCAGGLNVMAIVVQADKSLFQEGQNQILSVWGSTHVGE